MAKPYPLEDKPRGKCRRWQLRKSTGRDPATGKYRRQNKNFEGTWTEACRAQLEFEREAEAAPQADRRLTVEQYLKEFREAREASGDFRAATIDRYRANSKALCMHLGHATLSTLTSRQIEQAYTALRQGESPSGKPLSGTYVEGIHRTLNTALKRAVKLGLIPHNPCEDVTPPRNDTPEKRALPTAGIVSLVSKLGDSQTEIMVLMCIFVGMRRGEVVGLSWGDVDFENRTINIVHGYDKHRNLNETKTRNGVRPVPMPERIAELLDIHQRRQIKQINDSRKETSEGPWQPLSTSPVFCDEIGQRMRPDSLTQWWDRHRDDYGLGGWTLHELRHSYLSELARQGVPPKVMQLLAGHSKIQTTLAIYTHANMDDKRGAVDGFESTITERFGVNLAFSDSAG